jgi:hypothetical protein
VVMLHGCKQSPETSRPPPPGRLSCALPAAIRVRKPRALLELASPGRPAPRERRACGDCGAYTAYHQDLQGRPLPRIHCRDFGGGSAAAIIGSVYPELYAAVGVHSGIPRGKVTTLRGAMSAMRSGAGAGAGTRFGKRMGAPRPTIVFHGDLALWFILPPQRVFGRSRSIEPWLHRQLSPGRDKRRPQFHPHRISIRRGGGNA